MSNTVKKHWVTGLAVAMVILLSACGQKGDLYLPPEEVTQHHFDDISHV